LADQIGHLEDFQDLGSSYAIPYLFNLLCAVSSGTEEDHTESIKKTQWRKEDVISYIVTAQLFEHIKAKFSVCRAQGAHFYT
jgi:hypothetical protein